MSIPLFSTQIEKTTVEWDTENPVLGEDVIGIEIMSNGFNRFKRGNGVNPWNRLPYLDKIPPMISIDSALSDTSENPVQNKVITEALKNKSDDNHTHANTLYINTYRWNRTASSSDMPDGNVIFNHWSDIDYGVFTVHIAGGSYGTHFCAIGYKASETYGSYMLLDYGKSYTRWFHVLNGSLTPVPHDIHAVTVKNNNTSNTSITAGKDIDLYNSAQLDRTDTSDILATGVRYSSSYGYGIKVGRTGYYLISAQVVIAGTTGTGTKTIAIRKVLSGTSSFIARAMGQMTTTGSALTLSVPSMLVYLEENSYLSLYSANQITIPAGPTYITAVYTGS